MSFSQQIKEELLAAWGKGRHCHQAELAALWRYGSGEAWREGKAPYVQKGFTLCKKAYKIDNDPVGHMQILGEQWEALPTRDCCKRAYLRGAFLAAGSVADPKGKSYHGEWVCRTREKAKDLQGLALEYQIPIRLSQRKGQHIAYLKDGEGLGNWLRLMGAYAASMELENCRILKEVRENVNRQVNCESANLAKTMEASARQLRDIRRIQQGLGLAKLPPQLRELALARLEHGDLSLQELGALLDPPAGKSAVNHRMRRLSELAGTLGEPDWLGE